MENGLSEVRIYRAIGEKLRVDPSAVQRPVKLFEGTGTVSSIQGCHEPLNKQLSAHDEMVILELVLEHPSMYLQWVRVLSHNRQVLMSVQLQYADFYKNRNSHTRNCPFELNNDMMSSVQISFYISRSNHTCSSSSMKPVRTNGRHCINMGIRLKEHVQSLTDC